MKHNPPSLPTRPPGPPLREPARRRVRGAAATAALALHLAVFTVGAVAATVAWDVVLATSVAYARDGGGEGEGGGDGGGDDGGGDDGGGDNSGRGGDDGGNSGRGGDDGGNSGRGGDDGPGDDGPGDDSGDRGRGRGSDDGRTDKGKNRTVVDRFLDTLSGRGRVVWSSARGNTIEVRYSDGWSERVGKDGYALLDPRRNVIVKRPAKPTDLQRLRAAAAR